MRFLIDESCDDVVVEALRQAGHDVKAVREWRHGAPDAAVIDLARSEERVLLTEDKDFDRLSFASTVTSPGVILIRYPAKARSRLAAEVTTLVEETADRLAGSFVVLQPGRVRIVVSRKKEPPGSH